MLILHDHGFRMVLLLFNTCLQSSSWQISSRRLRLAPSFNFISPNSMFLIHHEFEEGIRYILVFFIIIFLQGGIYIFFPSCTCIYSGLSLHINTSVIHNSGYQSTKLDWLTVFPLALQFSGSWNLQLVKTTELRKFTFVSEVAGHLDFLKGTPLCFNYEIVGKKRCQQADPSKTCRLLQP
jgi:hypothetical protein